MDLIVPTALYFLLILLSGFALGTLRTLYLVPRVGEEVAEFIETPVMMGLSYFAAGWITQCAFPGKSLLAGIEIGALALLLMLIAEWVLTKPLRGIGFLSYLKRRTPAMLATYLAGLLVFGAMPAITIALG